MARLPPLVLLFLAVGLHLAEGLRVRKELRKLTDGEYRAFITALSTMTAVPTDAGRKLFGPRYVSYMEIMMKHAVSVNDPRGDQGHFGPCFMTFHRALLLELEESLLSVSPELKALPYWDIVKDNPGGDYFGTEKYIFSDKYAGTVDAGAESNYGVTSGIFGWRQVPKFIAAQWPQYAGIFSGSPAGYMRSKTNANESPLVTRFPVANLLAAVAAGTNMTTGISKLPFGDVTLQFSSDFLDKLSNPGKFTLRYPEANYRRCMNPGRYKTWMEWNWCTDISVVAFSPLTQEQKVQYIFPKATLPGANTTTLLHVGLHWAVGSLSADGGKSQGDVFDVATSTNELLLFGLHHANIDRSAMTWQARAAKKDPSMVDKLWSFPATKAEYSTAVEGCLLNDVANANAPFTNTFEQEPASPEGYTHKEIIQHTIPGASPYTYDDPLLRKLHKEAASKMGR